jgi:ACS family tartrate transporter-like MFS transporter
MAVTKTNPTPTAQGSGVFYAGYVLFQIPSNLLLSRLGAKLWLPLITAAFGTVAVCSALFIKGPASFYALRLALGITEAGRCGERHLQDAAAAVATQCPAVAC